MSGQDQGEEGCTLARVMSLSDMVLGFFEDSEGSPDSGRDGGGGDAENGSSDDESCDAEERRAFWESQHQLLQAALSRNSSLESRIRRDAEAALRQLRSESAVCSCSRKPVGECRDCLLRVVLELLRSAGYNSALCKSKWRSSADIPKGEHTYIDVVETTKKGAVRVVVELFFRAEFEVARASQDYSSLVRRLPEVFAGKPEKLRGVIKVVCAAAKKCLKDNKMHMAPWRKYKYMQAKWLTPCDRVLPRASPLPTAAEDAASPDRQRKLRASMLTSDLLEAIPGLHRAAAEVVCDA